MKRLLGLAALLLVVAAGPCAAKAPAAFGADLSAAADTIRVTANACSVPAGPTVGCAVVVTGTVGGSPIAFPAVPNLAPGGTLNVAVQVACTAAAAPISVTVSSRGFNANSPPDFSAPTVGTGTAVLPACQPGQPGAITVQIIVVTP